MGTPLELPLPSLSTGRFGPVVALTDGPLFESRRVRVAFTERGGGVSTGPYASLNLGGEVGDDPEAVRENRLRLAEAFGAQGLPCVVPRQVHGDMVLVLGPPQEKGLEAFCALAQEGADALVVEGTGHGALLCFADCVPLIGVSPSGRFTVVHAGWRGVKNGVAVKALQALVACDAEAGQPYGPSELNVYIGPHIRRECFEAGPEVCRDFQEAFGDDCLAGPGHIDLARALTTALAAFGADPRRIVDACRCTVCDNGSFFSYRAQGGVCGRQGAYAIRLAGA